MSDAPHPRVLFQDVPPEVLALLGPLVGTSGVVRGVPEATVHESDWDLVVSFSPEPFLGDGLHVLSFGGVQYPAYWTSGSGWTQSHPVHRDETLLARAVQVHENVEKADQRRILERTIVHNDPGTGQRKGLSDYPSGTVPLVTAGTEGKLWAAMLTYGKQLLWALPAETTNHVEWLANVLRQLHLLDPDRFPAEPDWRGRGEWATPEMRNALAALDAVEREREGVLAELNQRETAARESVEKTTASGGAGMLRLLTDQGDDLVDAVAEAFRSFGFNVRDMDDHHDKKSGAKLEDLRVTYPNGSGDWTCLAEVKGYGKGARANDVGQIIGRPPLVFLKETGREADALWHIVNSNREQDPSTRPTALTGGGDLVALAAAGGCFIDTRDLFRAWRDVAEGSSTAEKVRTSLMDGHERWEWSASEEPL